MEKYTVVKSDLLYPELSYKIMGVLFEVYNELGHGLSEQTYQKAVSVGFKNLSMKFQEQVYAPISFQGQKIASHYFDFLVEELIVLEIKKGDRFAKAHITQVYEYLRNKKLKLGILAYFAPKKVHYKRIVNLDS
jgi:GxxExxY protein